MQFYPSGTRIAGRYEVAGRPLMGGMGIVYLCFDHQEQRPVALKTFKPEFLPNREARARFLEEGNVWVRLGKHPHIVRCYGVFVDEPRPDVYLILELIAKEEGRQNASLRAWLTPGRPTPPDQALLIALQIARGMTHASTVIPGFVHRDLKPENVLVSADRLSNATINRVRVTDFGLVRGLQGEERSGALVESDLQTRPSHLTQIGALLGTAEYMAPEQWTDPNVTAQADIYAFGCILGEMVTGRMLVSGEPRRDLWRAHQDGAALANVQAAPQPLHEIFSLCLATDLTKRFANWTSVEAAVATAYCTIAGQPAPEPVSGAMLNRTDRVATGWSYTEIGISYLSLGQTKRAGSYFELAQAVGRAEDERKLEAAGLGHLAIVYRRSGDFQRAIQYCEQVLGISRETGNRLSEGAALGNLGNIYADLGDMQRAVRYCEQAIVIHRETGHRRNENATLNGLGKAYLYLGDSQRANWCFEEALVFSRETGDREGESTALNNLGTSQYDLGLTRSAIESYEQALLIHRDISDRDGECAALFNIGRAYNQLGDDRRAVDFLEQALAISRDNLDRHGEGKILWVLGNVHQQRGDTWPAVAHYDKALAISREICDNPGIAATCFHMALIYDQLGIPAEALRYSREATYVAKQIGETVLAQQAQQLVTQLEGQ